LGKTIPTEIGCDAKIEDQNLRHEEIRGVTKKTKKT